ncbi:SGNH/GDSL hydrolase family protein [Flaviflexus massiliensis]|uniref:hypothetical protein n=1 Tax=Flaviflexus massiliensis TaxID=1522309 RepID=UPI0006D5ADF9|nr:hypothetical protein [Flaviflexus massiliensis]
MIVAGLVAAGLLLGGGISPLAIGDSYASGTGMGNYSDTLCMRSIDAPIEYVGDFVGHKPRNVACNGAWTSELTTDRVIKETRDDVSTDSGTETDATLSEARQECQPMEGARTEFTSEEGTDTITSFCTITLYPQIEMVEGATDVFVTIGGNDIGFSQIAGSCLILTDEAACEAALEQAEDRLPAVIEQEREALAQIMESNDVRVHVVPYPRMVSTDDLRAGNINVSERVTSFQERWEQDLRDMTQSLSADGSIYYVESVAPLWQGHGIGGEDSWINTSGNGAELLHPTPEGWEAMNAAYIAHLGTIAIE